MTYLLAILFAIQTHPVALIDGIVRDGIRQGAYPGAVVMIGMADTVLLAKGYGRLTWSDTAATPSRPWPFTRSVICWASVTQINRGT